MNLKKAVFVLIAGGAILGTAACTQTNNSPDQIIEIEKKLKNGKSVTCLVLIEDVKNSNVDEWETIDCNWEGVR